MNTNNNEFIIYIRAQNLLDLVIKGREMQSPNLFHVFTL